MVCLPAVSAFARAAPAVDAAVVERHLHLISTHTGEELDARYFSDGAYNPEQLVALNRLLRDHRTGDIHAMDPKLFDLMHELALAAGREPRYEIISGYRSPATNAKLAAASRGVASNSLHMQGRAIDVRLVGLRAIALKDLALARQIGGVGSYPVPDFVHLDTGRVRSWSG